MVTLVYKRKHLDGYNNIHDMLLFMYVDAIGDSIYL